MQSVFIVSVLILYPYDHWKLTSIHSCAPVTVWTLVLQPTWLPRACELVFQGRLARAPCFLCLVCGCQWLHPLRCPHRMCKLCVMMGEVAGVQRRATQAAVRQLTDSSTGRASYVTQPR